MDAILKFFNRMDARAARAVWVTLALFGLVAVVFLVGRFGLNLDSDSMNQWFASAAGEWYALPITILVFTVLAFVGAPQFVLIGAAVFALGPVEGFIYSWIATMVSASVNFWLGRYLGADTVRRYGGQTVNRISSFVGRNGFWASMIVRIVPSAPFIVVNMAAGVSRMSYFAFIAGAGVGVIPKTATIAFFSSGLFALFAGGGWEAGIAIAVAAVLWVIVMLFARRLLRSESGLMAGASGKDDEPATAATGSDEAVSEDGTKPAPTAVGFEVEAAPSQPDAASDEDEDISQPVSDDASSEADKDTSADADR